jgi:proline dehydrogenase
MLDNASKAFFHLLARSGTLKKLASRYGMRSPTSFGRRFIAGEMVEEAILAARQVEAAGLLQTLDYLGESVRTLAEADAATRDYLRVIDAILLAGIGRNLSLKLTQLGLDVDRASAVDNLRRILERAQDFSSASTWRAPVRKRRSGFSRPLGAELPEHRCGASGGSARTGQDVERILRWAHGSAS